MSVDWDFFLDTASAGSIEEGVNVHLRFCWKGRDMKKSHKKCKTENLRISNNRKDPRKQPQMKLDARVRVRIRELSRLLKDQDGKCWEIGDLCIDLLDNDHLSLGQIAALVNYSKTRISHFKLTCKIFFESLESLLDR